MDSCSTPHCVGVSRLRSGDVDLGSRSFLPPSRERSSATSNRFLVLAGGVARSVACEGGGGGVQESRTSVGASVFGFILGYALASCSFTSGSHAVGST